MDGDFLLLHRMQNGDDQAIESFVRKYYPKILRYCHLHIKDSGFAEDLTQETFARFFRTLHQYQHYGKAANYLYVIAGNLCRDYYRKPEELPMEELPEHPVCLMESLDLRMDVHSPGNPPPSRCKRRHGISGKPLPPFSPAAHVHLP